MQELNLGNTSLKSSDSPLASKIESVDLDELRKDIANPDRGFVVIKNLLSIDQVEAYRQECETFIDSGRVCYTRINTDSIKDYVHPRSHDRVIRTHRIYQYFHNKRSPKTDGILSSLLRFRSDIEKPWRENQDYAQECERLQDYVIVTRYSADTGMLPRHQDYAGKVSLPLLQFLVLLSEPGVDFKGGEFGLYTKSGRHLRVIEEFDLKVGDALLFDKSLYHEVEPTIATGGKGRWTVLIGARAERNSAADALLRQILFSRLLFPITRLMKSLFASS